MKKFLKVNSAKAEDKKSVYKKILYFYTLIMNYHKEKLKNTIPFIIASKRIKYPRINITTKVKGLYTENS